MAFFRKITLAIRYLFDSNIPLRKKVVIIVPILYLVSPVDLIPDPVIGLGIVDDLVLITYFINKISEVLSNYQVEIDRRDKEKDIEENIIEGVDYTVKGEDDYL